MRDYRFIVLIVLAVLPPLAARADDSRSYQDCVLNATREGYVQDRRDIGRIKELCEQRFPHSAPKVIGEKLDNKKLDKIDIYTNRGGDGSINGSVYNGNPDVILTRLSLLLTPHKTGDAVKDFFDSEEYRLNLKIPPYKTKSFHIDAKTTKIKDDFSSKLIQAWGY